jgi:hypothetical protein
MGNSLSISKQPILNPTHYCPDYQHSDIVNAIYTVLSRYQIEAMCDCASWLLRELLISHKKYEIDQVKFICSIVNNRNHVFVLDKQYNYYIDITSEQFEDKNKNQIQPCIGSKSIDVFKDLGYEIDGENNTEGMCKLFCSEPYVLEDKGNRITRTQLLNKIKSYLGIKGGKRKKSHQKSKRSRR